MIAGNQGFLDLVASLQWIQDNIGSYLKTKESELFLLRYLLVSYSVEDENNLDVVSKTKTRITWETGWRGMKIPPSPPPLDHVERFNDDIYDTLLLGYFLRAHLLYIQRSLAGTRTGSPFLESHPAAGLYHILLSRHWLTVCSTGK
jgi:hypothetical protein